MEKVRIEADNAIARAEKAEAKVKELEAQIATLDTTNQSLSNKISLLTSDIERAETRIEDVIYYAKEKIKSRNTASVKDEAITEALERKVGLLEKSVDDKERDRKELVEKYDCFSNG